MMIKTAKKAIYGILGNADVTDEELITALYRSVESSLQNPWTRQISIFVKDGDAFKN